MWLSGLLTMPGMRDQHPWLVPVHIALYTLHMLQEEFDIKQPTATTTNAVADVGATVAKTDKSLVNSSKTQANANTALPPVKTVKAVAQ